MARTPKTETIVLLANETKEVNIDAKMLTILSCTVASFHFAFDNDVFSVAYPGIAYLIPEGVEKVTFKDTLGGGCTIQAVFSDGLALDSRYSAAIFAAMATSLAAIDLDLDKLTDIKGGTDNLATILGELQGDATFETVGNEITTAAATAAVVLAANTSRKGCVVQAKSTNAGNVFIGFDNTVTNTRWILELQPGQGYTWDDYRGAIYCYSVAAGENLGYGEW